MLSRFKYIKFTSVFTVNISYKKVSITLQMVLVKLIGLQFFTLCLFPLPLYIGITFACFHSLGNFLFNDFWNIKAIGKHSSSENIFNIIVSIASGSDENLFGNCFKVILIVSQLNAMSSFRKLLIIGIIDLLPSSFEYVELKNLTKRLAAASSSNFSLFVSSVIIVLGFSRISFLLIKLINDLVFFCF